MSESLPKKSPSPGMVAAVAALILGLFLLWPASQVFLVLFASVLFATLIDGLAGFITLKIPISATIARSIVIFFLVAFVVVFFMVAGPQFSDQMSQLSDRLPKSIERLEEVVPESWSKFLQSSQLLENIRPSNRQIMAGVTGIFSTAFEAVLNLFIIFFIGLYLAVQPGLYVQGIIHLIPRQHRDRGREVVLALGHALAMWLVGRFASMTAVGVLTLIGLTLIGMPLALILGIIAGALTFVPYIGPIVSAIPALLIGLTESPLMALYVLVLYVVVQFIEGNVITPVIQRRAVLIPPAVLLSAQFTMGIFYGLFGMLLATPLAVAAIVLVQMLYVQGMLKDEIRILGSHK